MFTTSDWRDAIGHPFVFDGKLYEHAPWWANFWWQWKALGTPAALACSPASCVAPFLLRRGTAVLLLAPCSCPPAFLAFGLSYALPYYYYTWEPPLLLLCALVIHALLVRGGAARVGGRGARGPAAGGGRGAVLRTSRASRSATTRRWPRWRPACVPARS